MKKRVYITGDTHGEFDKIYNFLTYISEPSVIIVAGDFGGVWCVDEEDCPNNYTADFTNQRAYEEAKIDKLSEMLGENILMFVCGNHENFDRLYKYPEKEVFGGMTHEIRKNIFHMERAETFDIDGLKIFAFGGAFSHDIQGGSIDMDNPNYIFALNRAYESGLAFRIKNVSWWEAEKPSDEEIDKGYEVINGKNFDYIVTHQTNMAVEEKIGIKYDGHFGYEFPDFLRAIDVLCNYKKWFFGHYHIDKEIDEKHRVIYDDFVELTKEGTRFVF